nr:type II secretion system inner membrane protein GspF [Gammaproteobacteria bacterium]
MPAFEYVVLDDRGRTRTGVLQGETPRYVRKRLRDLGWAPMSLRELDAGANRRRGIRIIHGISNTDRALVFRQLSTMVRAGVAVADALRLVARQVTKGRLERIMLGVHGRVVEGKSLGASLADLPHIFPELYSATVAAGERTGHLVEALDRLADYAEQRQHLRQKTLMALLYPVLLTAVATLAVAGLLGYVVPEVVQVFVSIGQELPWLTRALIAVSGFLRQGGVWLLIGIIAIVVGFRYLLRVQEIRLKAHRALLELPLVSRIIRGMNAARFLGTLGMLTASAVPMLEALRIAASVVSNLPMRRIVEDAARKVREGSSLRAALERGGYFPPIAIQLVASGEASGELDQMLQRAAASQDREMETLLMVLLGLFEPLLILLMGSVVLVIVLAILLPIFELNQLVK